MTLIDVLSLLGALLTGFTAGWFGNVYRITKAFGYYPKNRMPLVSNGQSVCVLFRKDDQDISHRSVSAEDLRERLARPKGGPPKDWFVFSHVDSSGRFVYEYED